MKPHSSTSPTSPTSPKPRRSQASAQRTLERPRPADDPELAEALSPDEQRLDPERLAAAAQHAAAALLRQGEAANTRRAYGSALRYWGAWYAARYGGALSLPVPVPVVLQFIVDHAVRQEDASGEPQPLAVAHAPGPGADVDNHNGSGVQTSRASRATSRTPGTSLVSELPLAIDQALVRAGYKAKLGAPSLNTLIMRISVLSKAHQIARARDSVNTTPASSAENPCADPLVRELLARTRRAYAQRGATPHRQRALTKDPLEQLLATCDDSLAGTRDRALLLFAWATGGRRRSEVADATLENLQRIDATSFVYTLTHSKTNQSGQQRAEDAKPLVGRAAAAMQAWLAVLASGGVREGAIFRRIRRGGHLGEPLAPAAVRDIVKSRCALAGVVGAFSAHSLRAGFVTEAGRQNMPLAETMALTGHHSVATVVRYFRAESGLLSAASRMLEDPPT